MVEINFLSNFTQSAQSYSCINHIRVSFRVSDKVFIQLIFFQVGIRWNEHKDHSGGSVEMKMLGESGAFFGISSMWEETHLMDAGHELDPARILTEMMRLDQLQDVVAMRRSNISVPHL